MQLYTLVHGYNAIEELADNNNLKNKEQWSLYNLRKKLRQHVEFQQERKQLIANKYKDKADENGTIYGEDYVNYVKEIEELNNMDIDWHEPRTILPLVDGINFKTIEALDTFIEFYIEK